MKVTKLGHYWATFVSATSEKLLKEVGIEFKKLELGKEEEL